MTSLPAEDQSSGYSPNSPFSRRGDIIAEELGVVVDMGLSNEEVDSRLRRTGPNILEGKSSAPWWLIFLRQFSSIVVWLLLVAALVSGLTNGISEAVAIIAVLLINAVIGFAVEWRAGRALDALRSSTVTNARVRRSGSDKIIDSTELVIGDIVSLAAGDRVPADTRLLEASNLQTDESALTGESLPVIKSIESVSFSSILTERRSMLYMGTMVVRGRGVGIITATGGQTEIGRVGQLLDKTRSGKTPLEKRLATLGTKLVYLVLAIGAAIFLIGLIRGDDPALMLEVAISLAVAAVPEGLPAMTTLILALGVLRLAREHAIVRKLSAVETLGSTTVICTDKTGTLTENRMSVQKYRTADGQSFDARNGTAEDPLLSRLLKASVLCNDASVRSDHSEKSTMDDPTETALIVAAESLAIDVTAERSRFDRIFERPFESVSKRMTIGVRNRETGQLFNVTKGAPQVVVDMCATFAKSSTATLPIDREIREQFMYVNDQMAESGLRVLAFADKVLANDSEAVDDDGYTFLGFAGMSDSPRREVPDSIRAAQAAGIRIVMLTGDQELTAKAIAAELKLGNGHDISSFHARDMIGINDAELAAAASKAHVFARVSPEDKLRIVEALQKAGEIVAVTGDGINDAPALKKADIGIAMGLRGTEVAKEAADVVLTDDNFSTIVKAIEGGRTIYSNIIRFVHLLFSHNLGEVLFIFAAISSDLPVPLLPLQILWLNLVTDIFPALALAVEPPSQSTMRHGPRRAGETLLTRRFLFLIGWQGIMLGVITLAAYLWALTSYGEGSHARTVALLAMIGVEFGHTFNCRSRTRSAFDGFFRNPYIFVSGAIVILLQGLAFYVTPLSNILGLAVPNRNDILVTLLCIAIPVLIVEITKLLPKLLRTPPAIFRPL